MTDDAARKGLIYALAAYGLWGLFPLFFKQVTDLPALEVLGHRVIWACAFTALILTLGGKWLATRSHLKSLRIWGLLSISALLIATNWGVFIYAVGNNQVLASSLGYFLTPLVSIMIGIVFLGEPVDRFRSIALGLAISGVAWQIISAGSLPWISLILAMTFGIYGLVRKQTPVDTLSGMLIETLVLLPLALGYWIWLVMNETDRFFSTPYDGMRLIAMGVLTSLPLIAFAAAARRLSLTVIGFLTYLAPTGHFLLAVFVYDEPFNLHQLISFGLIWLALLVFSAGSLVARRKHTKSPAV